MEALLLVNKPVLLGYVLWFSFSLVILLDVVGAYEPRSLNMSLRKFLIFLFAAIGAAISLLILFWVIEYQFIGRYVIANLAFGGGSICYVLLLILEKLTKVNPPRTLLLLEEENSLSIKREAEKSKKDGVWFSQNDLKSGQSLEEFCKNKQIDYIVFDRDLDAEETQILALLASGLSIFSLAQFWESFFQKIPTKYVDNSWFIRLDLKLRNPLTHKIRRVFDFILAFTGLLITFPLLCLVALAIILDSGMPVLFSQKRVGAFGKLYTIHKLRTMRVDAESKGAMWATKRDERTTPLGRFLRKYRIDEIPQFWNVIRGEMSLVGPRPERPEFINELSGKIPHWSSRTLLKPGLTGWAQILHSYSSDIKSSEEKLAYDLYYIKNASFTLDLEIILSTLRSLKKGSR